MRDRGSKKEVKKVNMVNILSIQEWICIFKPVETTIRKGLRENEER
jgi:hypothetical protein